MVCVLTALTLLALGDRVPGIKRVRGAARDAMAPVQRLGARTVSPFSGLWRSWTRYDELKKENARLRTQLDVAKRGPALAASEERELRELRQLSRFENVEQIPFVDARVIGDPVGDADRTLHIDRGSGDGIVVDMPVVTGSGLVGRISAVSSSGARVLLITDARSGVGVRMSRSGDVGLARGHGSGELLTVDRIDRDTRLTKNEVAMTSGVEGLRYPIGIPVGAVFESNRPDGALQQEVTLQPIADLEHLSFVRVLKWKGRPL